MKRSIYTVITLFCCFISAAQKPVDLSGIRDKESMSRLFESLKSDNERSYNSSYLYFNSAVLGDAHLTDVSISETGFEAEIDEKTSFSAENLLKYLRTTYKDELIDKGGFYRTTYVANNGNLKLNFDVRIDDDSKISENASGNISVTFKKQYDQPFAGINKSVQKQTDEISYYIDCELFNINAEVFVNGINTHNHKGRYRYMENKQYMINPFILNEGPVHIEITLTPGYKDDESQMPVISKDSYFTAKLCEGRLIEGRLECTKEYPICNFKEYVTDTIQDDGYERYYHYTGNPSYGGKRIDRQFDFTAHVSYDLPGWKNGNDLKKDPKIKQKISALYEKLARIIQNKDEKGLNDMMYQQGYETVVSEGFQAEITRDIWEKWMDMFEFAFTTKIEKDFDLKFGDNGKLVYAVPRNLTDMLRVIGKKQAEGFTLYMYEDKDTGELKFIR